MGAIFGSRNTDIPISAPIYTQGFESAGWESEFTGQSVWQDHVLRMQNQNPHSGSWCLRGNQRSDVTDVLTGLPGEPLPLLDYRGPNNDIVAKTHDATGECFYRFWFRHDDYNYHLDDDGNREGKLLWFMDDVFGPTAMYINNMMAGTGGGNYLMLVGSNGGYSQQWNFDWWGYSSVNMETPGVNASTLGIWRKFEYYINYTDKYVKLWVHSIQLISAKHGSATYGEAGYGTLTSDGKSYYDRPPGHPEVALSGLTLKTKGFQHWWVRNNNIDEATDGATGYANGWQLDDIELWDSLPPEYL